MTNSPDFSRMEEEAVRTETSSVENQKIHCKAGHPHVPCGSVVRVTLCDQDPTGHARLKP